MDASKGALAEAESKIGSLTKEVLQLRESLSRTDGVGAFSRSNEPQDEAFHLQNMLGNQPSGEEKADAALVDVLTRQRSRLKQRCDELESVGAGCAADINSGAGALGICAQYWSA